MKEGRKDREESEGQNLASDASLPDKSTRKKHGVPCACWTGWERHGVGGRSRSSSRGGGGGGGEGGECNTHPSQIDPDYILRHAAA